MSVMVLVIGLWIYQKHTNLNVLRTKYYLLQKESTHYTLRAIICQKKNNFLGYITSSPNSFPLFFISSQQALACLDFSD